MGQKNERKKTALPQKGNLLLTKTLKPINYIMDDFLSTSGVYLLAGASKMGKTWFTLDLSIAISQGKSFMGKKTQQSKTLYIDLESSETSLKSRLKAMYPNGVDLSSWDYIHTCKRIGEGFEEEMYQILNGRGYKLVVVDVFVKIRSDIDRGMTEYKHDYNDLSVLKRMASYFDMCFLIITHLRKMKDEHDVFNQMTGSTGLMGASDGSILLARARGEDDATIHTEGRDIKGDSYAMKWDRGSKRWNYIGLSHTVKEENAFEDFLDLPLYKAIREILESSVKDKNGELIISANDLFDKLCFEYSKYKSLPLTVLKLGHAIKENVVFFRKAGILINRKRLKTGTTYSLKLVAPIDEDLPFRE